MVNHTWMLERGLKSSVLSTMTKKGLTFIFTMNRSVQSKSLSMIRLQMNSQPLSSRKSYYTVLHINVYFILIFCCKLHIINWFIVSQLGFKYPFLISAQRTPLASAAAMLLTIVFNVSCVCLRQEMWQYI